jgi:hypothetical protein
MSERRLTGRQIVTVVVAICAAIVLAPASVYAATTFQRVKIVDATHSARVAKVSSTGRVLTSTNGSVTAGVHGTVNALPAVQSTAFSVTLHGSATLHRLVPAFKSGKLMITSFTYTNLGGVHTAAIYHYSDGTCSAQRGYYLFLAAQTETTASASFPTPVSVSQRCALVWVGDGWVTITGYLVP